jgi:ABC-type antimicrobial peptide transport system permease subunit
LDKGTDTGIRGIYRTFTGGFIPVLTSQNFSDITGINGEDIFVAEVNGGYVPLKPIGTTQYFPTMNPNRSPFIILDVDALLDFIELRGLTYSNPNEIFADIDLTERRNILSNINDVFKSDRIMDQELRLDGLSIDPLTVAGWNVMSQIALWIGLSTLILAYFSFMKTHTKEMLKESTLFNSIGLGKIRRIRILLMENLAIVVFGVFGGVISGLFTSIITLNSVTRFYFGEKLLPPYILRIDWVPFVFTLIFIMVIILVFVLLAVIRDTKVIKISQLYSRN